MKAHSFISCGESLSGLEITNYIQNYWIPFKKGEMAELLKTFDNIFQNEKNLEQEKQTKK